MATETLEAPPAKADAPTMTARERVIAMENQAQAEHKSRIDAENARLSVSEVTDEPLPGDASATEPTAEEKAATDEAARVAAEAEAKGGEAEDDTAEVPRNEKGQFIVREKRFKDLLADRAKLRSMEAELARFQIEDMKDTNGKESKVNGDGKAAPPTDPMQAAQAKVTEAEAAIEAADLEYDKASEEFAEASVKSPIRVKQRAAIKALAQAEADLRILSSRGEDTQRQAFTSWKAHVDAAAATHKELRDTLYKQDVERFPDLANRNSQLFQRTEAILSHWFKTGDADLTAPDAERLALEKAARSLGVKVPPVEAVKSPPAPVKEGETAAANAAALRTRGSVIAGSVRAAPAAGNATEVFAKMNQAQRRDFLIKMEAKHPTARR